MPRAKPISQAELEIARRFKFAREQSSASRTYVGARLGVDSQLIARLELGRVPLKYKLGRDFCVQFSVSPAWLATGAGPRVLTVHMPEAAALGFKDTDLFSAAYHSKLEAVLSARSLHADGMTEASMRLWCIDDLLNKSKEWFRAVPIGKVDALKRMIEVAVADAFVQWGSDSWEVEARRRVDMEQLAMASAASMHPFMDANKSEAVTEMIDSQLRLRHGFVFALWPRVAWHLGRLLKQGRGDRSVFQKLGLPLRTVEEWLDPKLPAAVPSAELAVQMLAWVVVEQINYSRESGVRVFNPVKLTEEEARTVPLDVKHSLTSGRAAVKRKEMPTLSELRKRLANATRVRGQKSILAKELGVTRQAVSQWIAGATNPEAETALKLLRWIEGEENKLPSGNPPGAEATEAVKQLRSSAAKAGRKGKKTQ